jgi:hypothetical protein
MNRSGSSSTMSTGSGFAGPPGAADGAAAAAACAAWIFLCCASPPRRSKLRCIIMGGDPNPSPPPPRPNRSSWFEMLLSLLLSLLLLLLLSLVRWRANRLHASITTTRANDRPASGNGDRLLRCRILGLLLGEVRAANDEADGSQFCEALYGLPCRSGRLVHAS